MGWIDKHKGAGPWPFIEQYNKWGYLNNPRWSLQQDAQKFCSDSGLPNLKLNRSTHKPCGHWHKGLTSVRTRTVTVPHCCFQSADVYLYDGKPVVLFVMWMDITPFGTLSLLHDYSGRVFVANVGMISYGSGEIWSTIQWDTSTPAEYYPAVAAISDDFWVWVLPDYITQYVDYNTSVWVCRSTGVITKTVGLLQYSPTGWYYSQNYKSVSIKAGGIIVSPEHGTHQISGDEEIVVIVSTDYGASWSQIVVYDVPPTSYSTYSPEIAIDSDGTFWVMFTRWDLPGVTTYEKVLYKSINNGTTWTYVNAITFGGSPNYRRHKLWIDGTDLYVVDDKVALTVIHKSTDYGVTFVPINTTFDSVSYDVCAFAVSGSIMLVSLTGVDDVIKRSDDGGASWVTVVDFNAPACSAFYTHAHFRRSGNVWIYTAAEFYLNSTAMLGYYISEDNGVTWSYKGSEVSYFDDSPVTIYEGFPNEPQVWNMNF